MNNFVAIKCFEDISNEVDHIHRKMPLWQNDFRLLIAHFLTLSK